MKSNFKKAIFTYGLADVFAKAVGLFTSPFSTRLFTMSQFGAVPLLGAVWSPFALIQYAGMDSAYPFFYARKRGDEDGRQLIANASLFAYSAVLLIWLVFLVFGLSSNLLANYASVTKSELAFFILGLLPSSLIYWLCYLLRFLHRVDAYIKISLMGRILPTIVMLPLLPWFEQENRLLVSLAGGWLLSFLALIFALYEVRRLGFWPFRFSLLNLKMSRQMLKFGMLLTPAAASYSLVVVLDRILIGHFLGTDSVAVHAIAMAIGSLGIMLVSWFGLAFDPYLSGWIASGDKSHYFPKMQLLVSTLSVFFMLLSCLSAIWSAPVIQFLYPESYGLAASLVPLIIFTAGLTALSRLGVATAVLAQTPKYHTAVYGCAFFLNLISGWCLIPVLGVMGAVVGTMVAEAAILSSWIYLGRVRLRNLPLRWKSSGLNLLVGLGFIVFSINQSNFDRPWWQLLLLSVGIISAGLLLLHRAVGSEGLSTLYRYLRY